MAEQSDPQKTPEITIADILQSWPLYREFYYEGTRLRSTSPGQFGQGAKYFMLPAEIELFCPGKKCKKEQRWTCAKREVYLKWPMNTVIYTCNNCTSEWIEYFFYWYEHEEKGVFFKAGQYRELSIEPPSQLKLDKDNSALYKKALTSRNFSFGIGAVSYLRRVVHNRMDELLDLVIEAAKAESSIPTEALESLKKARDSYTFEDKIRCAKELLPTRLKPDGHNPFDVLHDFTSQGLHRKTEDECLEIFDRVKLTFEHLFTHLIFESAHAKRYAQELSALASKQSPKK